MLKGTVKWYNAKKGFGFIKGEAPDKDIFFHRTGHSELLGNGTLGDKAKLPRDKNPYAGDTIVYTKGPGKDGRPMAAAEWAIAVYFPRPWEKNQKEADAA